MDVSSTGVASMATLVNNAKAEQSQSVAVTRLVKEQMEQEGKQALQLIQSASQSSPAAGGGVGSKVDVMV